MTPPPDPAVPRVPPPRATGLPDDIDWDVVPPPPTSAFDRLQTRTAEAARSGTRRLPMGRRTAWLAVALVAVVAAALAGTWWLRRPGPEADHDLLVRFLATAPDFRPSYLTSDGEQAEAYVADVFGWPIGLPVLPGMRLVGVGEASLSAQLSVPAFRYEGPDGETAVVFVYDYVFLGQAENVLDLPDAAYDQLAAPEPVDARRLGSVYLVSWRERAVVYTAVTESQDVFERIGQAARKGDAPEAPDAAEPDAAEPDAAEPDAAEPQGAEPDAEASDAR